MDLAQLRRDLERDEGFVPHAYQDSEGYWTIGFGRLIDERLGGGITRSEGGFLLNNDMTRAINELDAALPFWRGLPEPAMRGVANMAFNMGTPRLLGFKQMIGALMAEEWQRAAAEALDSKWSRQVGRRADRIAQLIAKGWPP